MMKRTGFESFWESIIWLLKNILFGVLVMFVSRLTFLLSYGNWYELNGYYDDLVRAFLVGLKFDLKVLTFASLPLIVISFVRLAFNNRVGSFVKFFKIYSSVLMLLVVLFEIINFYFYKFYHTKISVIIFGFFEDDTRAVITSIWKEYPVIPIILFLVFWYFSLPNFTVSYISH